MKSLEPALSCIAALSSPNTGIIDNHAYMLALQADAENASAIFAMGSELISGQTTMDGIVLHVREWLEKPANEVGYAVDLRRTDRFYREIRAYWPELADGSLLPAYAGVRPKITPPDTAAADFLLCTHGSRHYLGLYGIESPGLTASLAIAAHVAELV